MAATMTPARASVPTPWLYGRTVDILCGYGLLYILSLISLGLYAQRIGLLDWPAGVGALIAMAISTPHYGATLLRVYDTKQDRRKYAFFAGWVTAFMVLAFGAGVFDRSIGSLLLTAYVFWSPWHFAGQNFGLAMMSLRRRGIPIDPAGRRLLYGSFILSYAVAFVAINTAGFGFAQGVGNGAAFSLYRVSVGHGISIPLLAIFGSAYLVVSARALVRIGRGAGAADLLPTVLLIATQSLWFVLPSISMTTRAFNLPPLVFTAIWISAAHSLQYLWVTAYYARQSKPTTAAGPFLLKSMLAGSVIVVLPPLLFAPGLVGPNAPLDPAAVGVLTFSVVNLHHFILDGAIWKLRDGRVARALLDLGGGASSSDESGRSLGIVRPVVYALGVVGFVFPLYLISDAAISARSGDSTRIAGAVERFAWFGRDSAFLYSALGQHRELDGDVAGAIEAYRRSLDLEPERLLESQRLAGLLIESAHGETDALDEAVAVAERASRFYGNTNPHSLLSLGIICEAAGRLDEARAAYAQALDAARRHGDSAVAFEVDARLRRLDRGS